ncbi:MAG: hypothetical protein A2096_14165 [Spirochaetes bacterium GWF1_41_5]|nr:MAG: hypothetical protein A2096_14165 [Spirochaetes bacterium GWF1_41_5]
MTINCLKLKDELQEKLYNRLNPVDLNDYIDKLKISALNNDFYQKLKEQSNKNLLKNEIVSS